MAETKKRSAHLVPLAAVQVVGLACGLIGVRWSSSIIPPELLGVYGLLVGTHLFGASVTHQGFVQHVQRFWTPQTQGRAYLRLLLDAMGRPTLLLATALVVVLVLLNLTTGGAIAAAWWAWMLPVNLLVVVAFLVHAALQAEQRYWAHFVVSAICSMTRSFLPPLLVTAMGATLGVMGAGFFLHVTLWVLAGAWFVRGAWRRPDAPATETIEPPQRFLGAFMGVGLFGWVASTAPRWFAALVLTPEHTGFFMLALNLCTLVPTAISLIGVSYTFPPLFAASRAGADDATLRRMTNRNVAVALLVGQAALLALAWCGPRLVGVLVDARYRPSMDWLLPAGGSALSLVSGGFFCNLLVARQRERACAWLTGSSAALRLAIMAGLAATRNVEAFRIGLTLIAWPTVALEWWLARRWLRGPAGAQ